MVLVSCDTQCGCPIRRGKEKGSKLLETKQVGGWSEREENRKTGKQENILRRLGSSWSWMDIITRFILWRSATAATGLEHFSPDSRIHGFTDSRRVSKDNITPRDLRAGLLNKANQGCNVRLTVPDVVGICGHYCIQLHKTSRVPFHNSLQAAYSSITLTGLTNVPNALYSTSSIPNPLGPPISNPRGVEVHFSEAVIPRTRTNKPYRYSGVPMASPF